MYTSKFFTFTIEGGDKFDASALNETAQLTSKELGTDAEKTGSEVFIKGETVISPILKTKHFQATNRWLFSAEKQDRTIVKNFLTKNLEIIASKLDILKSYIAKFKAYIDLTIYTDHKLIVKLTKKHIELLNIIGVDDITIELVPESKFDFLFTKENKSEESSCEN